MRREDSHAVVGGYQGPLQVRRHPHRGAVRGRRDVGVSRWREACAQPEDLQPPKELDGTTVLYDGGGVQPRIEGSLKILGIRTGFEFKLCLGILTNC